MLRPVRGVLCEEGIQTASRATCSIGGCEKPQKPHARGWCAMHYERWRMHGDPETVLTNYGKPPEQRFMEKVVEGPGCCWFWLGKLDDDGYAIFKVDGKNRKAHRWAYEYFVGPIPDSLTGDHLCRNRGCVNPAHLEPVTNGENQRRGLNGVLKTVCKNGHPWTSENVVTVPSTGVHTCRICRREAEARYRCKQRTMKGQV